MQTRTKADLRLPGAVDWYKKNQPEKADSFVGEADPGVQSVQKIFK